MQNYIAKEITDLFELSVDVEDQSISQRKMVTAVALNTILSRISGRSELQVADALSSQRIKASNFIQRYQYHNETTLKLDLFFDESSVRALLKKVGLPRWGTNRPDVLLWISIGDSQQHLLLGDDHLQDLISGEDFIPVEENAENLLTEVPEIQNETLNTIQQQIEIQEPIDLHQVLLDTANLRGLPVILPLMDLEDSLNISVTDVWGRFVQPIQFASARYEADVIVASQILKVTDGWQSSWILIHKDRTTAWETTSENIEDALVYGIDSIADQLASQYAVFEDSLLHNELLISVTNISNVEDYANFIKYMDRLTSIHKASAASISDDRFLVRLTLIGEQQSFIQELSLNSKMIVQNNQIFGSMNFNTQLPSLFFRWNTTN